MYYILIYRKSLFINFRKSYFYNSFKLDMHFKLSALESLIFFTHIFNLIYNIYILCNVILFFVC